MDSNRGFLVSEASALPTAPATTTALGTYLIIQPSKLIEPLNDISSNFISN